jgi:hypothetical protein
MISRIQQVLVVVDTEQHCVLKCGIDCRGHGSPSK